MNGFVAGYEATGLEGYGKAVVTFYEKLTQHHSYVTGGSNQGESWGPPDSVADAITDVRGPASSIPSMCCCAVLCQSQPLAVMKAIPSTVWAMHDGRRVQAASTSWAPGCTCPSSWHPHTTLALCATHPQP